METSSSSKRNSEANEPDEDQEGHESKRLTLVGELDVSVDMMDSVCLDADIRGEMNATTTHEINAMTVDGYSDVKNVKTDVGNIQQWKANLLPGKIVYGTKSGEIRDPLKGREKPTQRIGFDERAQHV